MEKLADHMAMLSVSILISSSAVADCYANAERTDIALVTAWRTSRLVKVGAILAPRTVVSK